MPKKPPIRHEFNQSGPRENPTTKRFCRPGLAGELGAAVTLVSEWLEPAERGYGTKVALAGRPAGGCGYDEAVQPDRRRADTAARLQTGRIQDDVASQEQNATAPASWAEKSYGSNSAELTTKALGKLVEFEAKLRALTHTNVMVEAPPIQVWDPNSGQWKKIQVAF